MMLVLQEEDLYQNVMPPKRWYQQTLYTAAGRFFDRRRVFAA
jgi:hypothetical protein